MFNISFAPTSLEEGASKRGISTDEYIKHCKDLFSKSSILALHDIDKSQTNSRQEIRFILQDLGYVFFCMTRAGKDFGCFRVMKINDINEVKNINRAFELNCTFDIESKDKTLTNANELKQFLKNDFEKYQADEKENPQDNPNIAINEPINSVQITYNEVYNKIKTIDKNNTTKALLNKFSQIEVLFEGYDETTTFKKLKDQLAKWKPSAKDSEFLQEIKVFYEKAIKIYFSGITWKEYSHYYNDSRFCIEENLSLLEKEIDYLTDIDDVVYVRKITKLKFKIDTLRRKYRDQSYISSSAHFEEIYNELKNIYFPSVENFVVYDRGGLKITAEISGDKSFIPQTILYKEKRIKDSDLITTPNEFGESGFFQSFCKALDSAKIAMQIQECYDKDRNDSYRENLEASINIQIKKTITKQFNKLYQGSSEYFFRLRLESKRISLSFSKKNTIREPLTLSSQSDGFQWFFNFFFNFLHSCELDSGDIVLLDELGGNLSIPNQRELRIFLKDFAKRSGITFIACVHTPYMIDIDCLDEIRIIEQRKINKESCGAQIINDFSILDENAIDSTAKIKQALGIDNYFSMVGGDGRIVFVEGITDYNYLTKFKLDYQKEKGKNLNIAFSPIGGLGVFDSIENATKDELVLNEKQKKILRELPKLARVNKDSYAILLVDNDKAGRVIKQHESEVLKIITINEAFEDKKESKDNALKYIENLFSQADVSSLNLLDSNGEVNKNSKKKSHNSVV